MTHIALQRKALRLCRHFSGLDVLHSLRSELKLSLSPLMTLLIAVQLGRYSNTAGQSTCTRCERGAFSAQSGLTSCTPCSPGTFAEDQGQSQCYDCPQGTFAQSSSNVTGAIDCKRCSDGF